MSNHSHYIARFGRENDGAKSCHHLLWPHSQWTGLASSALCNHPYFEIYIPTKALHSVIHQVIPAITVPDEGLCQLAFEALEENLEDNFRSYRHPEHRPSQSKLNLRTDPPADRLDFLIDLWRGLANDTVEDLITQRDLFLEYEENGLRKLRTTIASVRTARRSAQAAAALAVVDPTFDPAAYIP